MSRSQPALRNPAVRFFEWSAKNGSIRWYDKEAEENIEVALPFRFLVLDEVSTIGGGKKTGHGKNKEFIGYYSNALRPFDINKERFVVRSRSGIEGEGTYKEVKAISGAKLIAGIYAAFYDENKHLQIGYVKFGGSALSAWYDFKKKVNVETGVVSVKRGEKMEDEDGRVYYLPEFSHSLTITPETEAAAIKMDEELQGYLAAYFASEPREEYSGPVGDDDEYESQFPDEMNIPPDNSPPDDDDEIPF